MQVSFHATLRPIVGGKTVDVPFEPGESGGRVRDLMRAMVERWPELREHVYDENGGLSRRVAIYIDGRNARWLDGEDTLLAADQKIAIFPPVAGG
jgi:MoaD family protein